MNIAYANRSESYAIPAKELRWLMTEMIKEAKNRHNRPIENSADTGREEETEG